MSLPFALNMLLRGLVICATAYALGRAVQVFHVRVNYTRKVNHFVIFGSPILIDMLLPFSGAPGQEIVQAALFGALVVLLIRPVRERVPAVATMFASFDRPEDRPPSQPTRRHTSVPVDPWAEWNEQVQRHI